MKIHLFGAAMVLSIASIFDIGPTGVQAVAIATQDDLVWYSAAQTLSSEEAGDKKVNKKACSLLR